MRKLIEETEKSDEQKKKNLIEESGITGSKGNESFVNQKKNTPLLRKR